MAADVSDDGDGDAFAADMLAFDAYVPGDEAIGLCKLVSILPLPKFIFNSIAWFLPLYCAPVGEYKRFFGSGFIIIPLASIICSWYRGLVAAAGGMLPKNDDDDGVVDG